MERTCALLVLAVVASFGEQPRFDKNHVIPFGFYEPGRLTGGQYATIAGWNLRPTTSCTPLPTDFCGVRVKLGEYFARVTYVGPMGNPNLNGDQINFQVPTSAGGEGPTPIQVCVDHRCSEPVLIEFTSKDILLSTVGGLRVNMPVWIAVDIPLNPRFAYPFSVCPWDFGGYEVQLRKDGSVLPSLPAPKCVHQSTSPIAVSRTRRLPLHLIYRFDTPGTYGVRVSGPILTPDLSGVARTGVSDWHEIRVKPETPEQHRAWLRHMASGVTVPPSGWRQSGDFIASLLASTDEHVVRTLAWLLPPPRVLTGKTIRYSGPPPDVVNCIAPNALFALPEPLLRKHLSKRRLDELRRPDAWCQ